MRPRILALSGHDPSGGAGLQADIETAAAFGVSVCTLPSALTVQSSTDCLRIEPVEVDFLRRAADELRASFSFQALKFGLLPTRQAVRLAAQLADEWSGVPIVADPVLAAGGGTVMAQAPDSILGELAPHLTLLTPNAAELRQLTTVTEPTAAMMKLHEAGCPWVLMTAADEAAERGQAEICHLLSGPDGIAEYRTPRLPGRYRGSGCTLATAIAALLAQQATADVPTAVQRALQYCAQSLQQAEQAAPGIHYPRRGLAL